MARYSRTVLSVLALAFLAAIIMGADGCNKEVAKHCRIYKTPEDRRACSSYCVENRDFDNDPVQIAACQQGQLGYLTTKLQAGALADLCDQNYPDNRVAAQSCRAGVNAESVRYSDRNPHGLASDRGVETGNRR